MANSLFIDFGTDQTAVGVLADGTQGVPTLTFTADPLVGLFRIGTANVGATANGTLVWDWNTTRLLLQSNYQLQAGANVLVSSNKLAAAQLLIASQAIGDVLVADSTTTFARLGIAAAGSVLVSGSTPAWSAAPTLTSAAVGAGTAGAPSMSINGATHGFWSHSASAVDFTSSGSTAIDFNSSGLVLRNTGVYAFTSGDPSAVAPDGGLSRLGAASFALGNGTTGSFTGTLKLSTMNAVTAYQINGVAGASGSGTVLSQLTVVNGIVTSITIA